MMAASGKLHYSSWVNEGYTLCGRVITATLRVTSSVHDITCDRCRGSEMLDGQLGNMTHTGH